MRYLFLFFPLLIFIALFPLPCQAQKQTSVAEGYLQSISSTGESVQFRIVTVRNGDLDVGISRIMLLPSRTWIFQGLRRFRSQRWLITVEKIRNQEHALVSAYGLQENAKLISDSLDPFPEPLVAPVIDMKNPVARATLGPQEQEIVEITNIERWNNGMLPPLKQVINLHNAADGHSEEMAVDDFFAHCDLDSGLSPFQRMVNAGYNYNSAGENIAAGNSTASATMGQWMNSSGHRNNILSTNYREIGVGYEASYDGQLDRRDTNSNCIADAMGGPYTHYWTQNFGRRNSVYPIVIERELAAVESRSVDLYVYGPINAESMRFSNDGVNWSTWMAYTPDHIWELTSGNGEKTVYAEVSTGINGSGTVYTAEDVIDLNNSCIPMVFSNTTLDGTETYNACEIVADPSVTITGDIIFEAPCVILGNDFEVPLSATLEVHDQ